VVRPAYSQLVRVETRFWNSSGIDASFGVGGFELHAGTLATIASGGVAMATPDPPGALATAGTRFRLQEEPEQWRDWNPTVPIGVSLLSDGSLLPQPIKATLQWQETLLGIGRDKQRIGWVLPMANGRLLGPRNLLLLPADAVGQKASLQFEGHTMEITDIGTNNQSNQTGALILLAITDPKIYLPGQWPSELVRRMEQPEDCLIVTGSRDSILPLPAHRLQQHQRECVIDSSFVLNPDTHGASVVAVRDGSLVGILLAEKGQLQIAFPEAVASGH
jgi:paraquat-inducible protein B